MKKVYILRESDLFMGSDSIVNLGVFTNVDIAVKEVSKDYTRFDCDLSSTLQAQPVPNPHDIIISIKEVELNTIVEF